MRKVKNTLLFTLIFTMLLSFSAFAAQPVPELIGTSAISVDMDTNEIIYTKNIDTKVYPASITKLLTSILLAENKNKTDILKYTKSAAEQPAYSYGVNIYKVNIGDPMIADNVMDGLLLYSGNDFAYMVADNVAGNAENFAKLMNKKAKQLGMAHSHFVTPNGLDSNTDNHYTTAYDLTKLVKAAYENDWVRESMGKKTSIIGFANGPKAKVTNRNKLLGINGCIGGKTGFTDKAGRCLVAIYNRNGRHIIGVVMNSEYDTKDTKVFKDMQKLIDWSYNATKDTLIDKNTKVYTVKASYKIIPFIGPEKNIEIPLEVRTNIDYYNNDIVPKKTFNISDINPWKLDKKTSLGTITITQRDYSKTYDLYSSITTKDILHDNMLIYIATGVVIVVILILLFALIISIKKRRTKRRPRRYY